MHLVNTKDLIEKCRSGDSAAQRQLFKTLSAPMMGVCLRYLKSQEDAEDVLSEGFFKMFRGLAKFKFQGEKPFFGWVKTIMVNECLMKLRKDKDIRVVAINEEIDQSLNASALENLAVEDILKLIKLIPVGYRTVFNLYEVEGYNHKEIGELLGVSTGTSKSQLFKAKKILKEILSTENSEYGT